MHWVVPPPSNSHHQDYYILVGDPYKPSFATVTGRGDNPSYTRIVHFWVKSWTTQKCFDFEWLLKLLPFFG